MSNKSRETTVLRPSLKKQPAQAQARSRDSDAKRHVTFATPKLPSSKCNLPKQHSASDQSISKKQKSVVDTHRKRIPSVQLVELRAKKNKHNEQIVRLCEAQEALVKSDYVIRRMGKKAKEHEAAATALLQNAVSLIEIDVLRSFEKQRIEDLLDSVEQQQQKAKQELHEELAGFNERIDNIGKKNKTKSGDVIAEPETDKAIMELESVDEGVLAKILVSKGALATIEKCNEMLDVQLTSTEDERDLSVVEEMKLLSADVSLYLDVLDSLKQFHL